MFTYLLWPKISPWLFNKLAYLTLTIEVPQWLLVLLTLILLGAVVFVWRLFYINQPVNIHLYKSLSTEAKEILKTLAKSELGKTEYEIFAPLSLPTQYSLWLIDQLVSEHQVIERTEPQNGGAFWFLSERGRALASELNL